MSRSAPGIRRINWSLRTRVSDGFYRVNGRPMSDYDLSVMSLTEARQYAGLRDDAAFMAVHQPAETATSQRRSSAQQADSARRTRTAVNPGGHELNEISSAEYPDIATGRFSFFKRRALLVPAALGLVLVFGVVVIISQNGPAQGAEASESSSRTVKPEVTPVSNQSAAQDANQQAATAANEESTDAASQSGSSDANADTTVVAPRPKPPVADQQSPTPPTPPVTPPVETLPEPVQPTPPAAVTDPPANVPPVVSQPEEPPAPAAPVQPDPDALPPSVTT